MSALLAPLHLLFFNILFALAFVRKLALLRNQGIEQHLNEAGKEAWAPRMPSVAPAEQKAQKIVTPGITDLYNITNFGVTEKLSSETFVDLAFSSVETSELGTKIDDRITAEDWVKMAAESVGVTLEFAYAHLSQEDMRSLEMGYLNFEVLESSLAMKAKQARVGENRQTRGKGTFNGCDGFCDNLMKNPSIDSVSS